MCGPSHSCRAPLASRLSATGIATSDGEVSSGRAPCAGLIRLARALGVAAARQAFREDVAGAPPTEPEDRR